MHPLRCSWACVSPNFFSHPTLIAFGTCTLCAHSFHYFHGSCTFSYMHFMCTIALCTCTPNSYKWKINRKWWKREAFTTFVVLADSFLCTLHSQLLYAFALLISISKKLKKSDEKKTSYKLFAWVKQLNMKLVPCSIVDEESISPFVGAFQKKKGARLELWIVSWANMGFWCHVCTTLRISLICDKEVRSKTM